MNKSNSIKELATALTSFQAEMPAVPMNSINPFLKNKYADLGAMIEAARGPLTKNGLSVSQLVTNDGDNIGVETVLMHSSGEWISSIVTMSASDEKGKSAAQVAGSIITYMRRYSLGAVLGLYADEDTDGNDSHPKAVEAKVVEKAAVRMGKNWKGVDVNLDEKLGQKITAIPKFVELFQSKFDHVEHFRNHLKLHFNVTQAADLTWEQAIALHDHLYNGKDDPKFYKPEGKSISGWDAVKKIKQSYVDKGLESLYDEMVGHLDTRLGGLDGAKVEKFFGDILGAVGVLFENPPAKDQIKEIKDAADKEFGK